MTSLWLTEFLKRLLIIASPLNSINMLEAGMYQGVSTKAPEHRKHTENDPKCVELGWRCIPLAMGPVDQKHWGPSHRWLLH